MTMKNGACLTGALILSLSTPVDAALIQVGTGPDTSYFTLESPNVGLRQYAVSYQYDPVDQPLGGSDLLRIIASDDPGITFVINDFGSPSQPNEFFSSLTFNGITESNDFAPGGSTFVHWVAGGEAGAAGLGVPDPTTIPDDAWTLGSGLSVNFRLVEPGSNDALVFAPGEVEPSVAPIPEPAAFLLFGPGALLLLIRRRP